MLRTEIVFRRNANTNITVPWAVTRDSRGTVFGQPLGAEQLRMLGVCQHRQPPRTHRSGRGRASTTGLC